MNICEAYAKFLRTGKIPKSLDADAKRFLWTAARDLVPPESQFRVKQEQDVDHTVLVEQRATLECLLEEVVAQGRLAFVPITAEFVAVGQDPLRYLTFYHRADHEHWVKAIAHLELDIATYLDASDDSYHKVSFRLSDPNCFKQAAEQIAEYVLRWTR